MPRVYKQTLDLAETDTMLPFDKPKPIPCRRLAGLLDPDVVPLTVDQVTGGGGNQSKEYLPRWQEDFVALCASTKDDVGVCSSDGSRDPAGSYDMQFTHDGIPSPTTQNRRKLLFGQPKYHHLFPSTGRYLTLRERARVLGFDEDALDAQARHLSVGIRQVALGNTICVDVDAAVLDTIRAYLERVLQELVRVPVQITLSPARSQILCDLKRRRIGRAPSMD